MFSYIQKRYYKTRNTLGMTRHFVPAIREWRDSVYSFNKSTVKDTALKDELLHDTMWSLFLSSRSNKKSKKSLRMRSFIKRTSSKRTFISKPGIKQNSDKSIVTIFFFDRENQLLKKRVYFLKKFLKNNNLLDDKLRLSGSLANSLGFQSKYNFSSDIIKNIKWLEKISKLKKIVSTLDKEKKSTINKKTIRLIDKKMRILNNKVFKLSTKKIKVKIKKVKKNNKKSRLTLKQKRLKKYIISKKIRKQAKKAKINYNVLPKTIVPRFLIKRNIIRNMFLFLYLKSIVKRFFNISMKIQRLCLNCNDYINYATLNQLKKNKKCNKCGMVNEKYKSIRVCFFKNSKLIYYIQLNPKVNNGKFKKSLVKTNKLKIRNFKFININLSKIINRLIPNHLSNFDNTKDKSFVLVKLFNKFKSLNYKRFIVRCLFKELKVISTLSNIHFSKFRYTDYTTVFKNFIRTIYNKKVELNLVSLKYLHLDGDMFLDSLAIKLHKRKTRLFKILRKSLKLIKRPKVFEALLETKDKLTIQSDLNKKSKYENIHSVFNDRDGFSKNIYKFKTETNTLNNLKYKWISGLRLSAKGRLTRRYTASRALSKYINRGSLQNLQHLYIPSYEQEAVRLYRIRNEFKPNIQFTYKYGERMIGTFGLKGWFNTI